MTSTGVIAAVALGSNLGDRRAHIEFGFRSLRSIVGTRLTARSRLIETEPVGPGTQGRYLNAAALLETELTPTRLLRELLLIERQRGRDRSSEQRWGPRTLDLDLLLFGQVEVSEIGLTVPHPRLGERAFVLEPLAEIAAGLVIAGDGRTVEQMLGDLPA